MPPIGNLEPFTVCLTCPHTGRPTLVGLPSFGFIHTHMVFDGDGDDWESLHRASLPLVPVGRIRGRSSTASPAPPFLLTRERTHAIKAIVSSLALALEPSHELLLPANPGRSRQTVRRAEAAFGWVGARASVLLV